MTKHLTLFAFLSLLISGCLGLKNTKNKSSDLFKLSGKIETSECYWGGVAPTEEQLAVLSKKRPFPDFKLFIKSGDTNHLENPVIDSIVTNEQGNFDFLLPSGNYVLLSKHHLNRDVFSTYKNHPAFSYNEECMEKWWHKGISKINIKGTTPDSIHLHYERCPSHPTAIPCTIALFPPPPSPAK